LTDRNTAQVRALRALEALVAEHDAADVGTECRVCPESYPCETRAHAEDAAEALRTRMKNPHRSASGYPKHIRERQ
jgi:hypothetical protein